MERLSTDDAKHNNTRIPGTLALLAAMAVTVILPGCGDLMEYHAPPSVTDGSRPDGTNNGQRSTPGQRLGQIPDLSTGGRPVQQPRSRWVPVDWAELQGLDSDTLADAWVAWQRSCERPGPEALTALCTDVKKLASARDGERRAWMRSRLQPYRIENPEGQSQGLLTGYYEPVVEARRQPDARFDVPLYRPPEKLAEFKQAGKPWFTRQDIDTLPEAKAALQGREIAWLDDPVAALTLQIQGSGRLRVTEPDGRQRMVRLNYAGTNDQPYRSVGSWLLQQGEIKDASWPGIRQWVNDHPSRVQEMLWANPRVTFFQEQALNDADALIGPRGAQGAALVAGRSIAIDPQSLPYGAPVWLTSEGLLPLQRLVLAQDTGSAITGAVRADFFVGTGPEAATVAGRLKQPLRLWVLWPK